MKPAIESRMLVRFAAIALPAASVMLLPPTRLTAQEAEQYALAGEEVAIYDIAGRVQMVATTGDEVVVEVRRGGGDSEALRVATGEIDGREALRVIFPDDDVVYPRMGRGSRTSFTVNENGTFGDGGDGLLDMLLDSDRVTVRGSGGGLEAWADLVIHVPAGREVAVHLGVGQATVRNVTGDLSIDAASGEITSRGTRGALWLDTGSGDITVADASGDINADTGSGDVYVTGVRGPRAYLDTGSGDIVASNVTAGEIEMDTGSGGIEADGLSGRDMNLDSGSGDISVTGITTEQLEVDTGSGSITIVNAAAEEATLDSGSGSVRVMLRSSVRTLVVDTGSGDVTIAVPPELGADIEFDTGSGDIELDVPVRALEIDDSYFRGRIGGGGGRVVVDTGSGNVSLVSS